MILTGHKLEEIGKALYGRYWPSIMARRIRRARRSLFHIRDDEATPWPELRPQLATLLDDQINTLCKLRDELREGVSEEP